MRPDGELLPAGGDSAATPPPSTRLGFSDADLDRWAQQSAGERFSAVVIALYDRDQLLRCTSNDFAVLVNDECRTRNAGLDRIVGAESLFERVKLCASTRYVRDAVDFAVRELRGGARFDPMEVFPFDGRGMDIIRRLGVNLAQLNQWAQCDTKARFAAVASFLLRSRGDASDADFLLNAACRAVHDAGAPCPHAADLFEVVQSFADGSRFVAIEEAARCAGEAEVDVEALRRLIHRMVKLGKTHEAMATLARMSPQERFAAVASELLRTGGDASDADFLLNAACRAVHDAGAPCLRAADLFEVVRGFVGEHQDVAIKEAARCAGEAEVDVEALRRLIVLRTKPWAFPRDTADLLARLKVGPDDLKAWASLSANERFRAFGLHLNHNRVSACDVSVDDFITVLDNACIRADVNCTPAANVTEAFRFTAADNFSLVSINHAATNLIRSVHDRSDTFPNFVKVTFVNSGRPASSFALSNEGDFDFPVGWSPMPDLCVPHVRVAVETHLRELDDPGNRGTVVAFRDVAAVRDKVAFYRKMAAVPEDVVQTANTRGLQAWFHPADRNFFAEGKRGKGSASVRLDIPLLFVSAAKPDFFRQKEVGGVSVVSAVGELKRNTISTEDAIPQALTVAFSAAVHLFQLGLPAQECMVPFFVANGHIEQHCVATLLESGFPVAMATSIPLTLSAREHSDEIIRARWVTRALANATERRVEELAKSKGGRLTANEVSLGLDLTRYFPKAIGHFVGDDAASSRMHLICIFRALASVPPLEDKVVFPISQLIQVPKAGHEGPPLRWAEVGGFLFPFVQSSTLRDLLYGKAVASSDRRSADTSTRAVDDDSGGAAAAGGGRRSRRGVDRSATPAPAPAPAPAVATAAAAAVATAAAAAAGAATGGGAAAGAATAGPESPTSPAHQDRGALRDQILDEVRSILRFVHLAGVVHMDLFPSNILWGISEGRLWVRLIDWDAALFVRQALPGSVETILNSNGHTGTPHPEVVEDGATARPDFDWWTFALIALGSPIEDPSSPIGLSKWIANNRPAIEEMCAREVEGERIWLASQREWDGTCGWASGGAGGWGSGGGSGGARGGGGGRRGRRRSECGCEWWCS